MGGRISKEIYSFYYFSKVSTSKNQTIQSRWKIDPLDLLHPLTEDKLQQLENENHLPRHLIYDCIDEATCSTDDCGRKQLNGATPLHLAAGLRNVQMLEDMVKAILDFVRSNQYEQGNKDEDVHNQVLNINWNVRDHLGYSPLSIAVKNQAVDSVQLLIDVGADPLLPYCTLGEESLERSSWSYLRYAAWHGLVKSLKALLTVKEINGVWDRDGKRAIHLAIEAGRLNIVKILLDYDLKAYYDESDKLHDTYWEKSRSFALDRFIVRPPDNNNLGTHTQNEEAFRAEEEEGRESSGPSSVPLEFLELLRGALRGSLSPDSDEIIPSITPEQPNQNSAGSSVRRKFINSKDRGSSLLHLAASYGNTQVLDFLIAHPAFSNSLHSLNEFGKVPIFMAVRHGHLSCFESLTKAGVSLSTADIENWSIMHEAVKYQHLDILNSLIDKGCDVNYADDDGWTPLHVAARFAVAKAVQPLVESGSDINAKTEENESVLQIAVAQKNNQEMLDEFLKHGPEFLDTLRSPQSPEKVLLDRSDFSMLQIYLRFLIKQCGIDDDDVTDDTDDKKYATKQEIKSRIRNEFRENSFYLHRCVAAGEHQVVRQLMQLGTDGAVKNSAGETALAFAARKGMATMVAALLEFNTDPDTRNGDGTRPLHIASDFGQAAIVNMLLDHGADTEATVPETAANTGFTPLMLAARRGHSDCIRILNSYGVHLDTRKEDGYSALHLTALNGHIGALRSLIKSGANTEIEEQNGFVPLHVAVRNQQFEASSALLAEGANIHARGPAGLTALHFASHICDSRSTWLLIQCGGDISARDNNHATALHYCARQQQGQSCIQLLLTSGCDIDAQDEDGDTPLHCACSKGIITNVRILLRRGADPNKRNRKGETALHLAAAKERNSIATSLMKYGAHPNVLDAAGATPYTIAQEKDNRELIVLIWRNLRLSVDDISPEYDYTPSLENVLKKGIHVDRTTKICIVCQNSFKENEKIRVLPCGHIYKSDCIVSWFGGMHMQEHDYCPLCQSSILPDKLPAHIGEHANENDSILHR